MAFASGFRRGRHRMMPLLLLAFAVTFTAGAARAAEFVTLQLKWTHAFQFAGYYAAWEQGYYREAGLDVRFLEASPGQDVVDAVVSGEADFGVGTSSLLLSRRAGQPVVVLGVVFQHSPLVLISRGDAFAQSLEDLFGKRVMIEPQSDELFAMLRAEGVALDSFVLMEHSLGVGDMIENRIDAMSAYSTVEPFALDQAGVAHRVYSPRASGIDFYGDNLFTSAAQLAEHPERVAAFRAASLRGWRYAMDNPEKVINLILSHFAPHQSRAALRYEAAAMADLVRPKGVAVGTMEEARWQSIARTYADLGLLPAAMPLDGFLYAPPPDRPWRVWGRPAAVAGAVTVTALVMLARWRRWRRTRVA